MQITFKIHYGIDEDKEINGQVDSDGTIQYDKSLGDNQIEFDDLIEKSFGYITEKKKYEIAREMLFKYGISESSQSFGYWLDNKLNKIKS